MRRPNRPVTFDAISRANHWIVAFAMIGMLGFGLYLENADLERSVRGPLIGLHKSLGVCVLVYGIWRVGYRIRQGFPKALGNTPAWQAMTATLVHWTLLAGVIVMPLSGIVMSVFGGRGVNVFNLLTIPAVGEFPLIEEVAQEIHSITGIVLIVVVCVHFQGVLKHKLFDRDATLSRMISGRG